MLLEINNLSRTYADADKSLTVLSGVNFKFPESASVAILGRSGVGKSTLLHLLGGLDHADSGEVLFDSVDISKLSDEKLALFRGRNIGFIFQFHHLLPEFTAVENVAMPLIIRGVDFEQARLSAEKILSEVGLEERFNHRPGELSGGEQQRVAIGRAVVAEPAAILADEPSGNLDVYTARAVQDLLLSIQRDLRSLLIVVTHNRELAESMDIVLEMQPGGALVQLS